MASLDDLMHSLRQSVTRVVVEQSMLTHETRKEVAPRLAVISSVVQEVGASYQKQGPSLPLLEALTNLADALLGLRPWLPLHGEASEHLGLARWLCDAAREMVVTSVSEKGGL